MTTINMQYFGGNGASSGKSGAGGGARAQEREREQDLRMAEEFESDANRYERQANALAEDIEERELRLQDLSPVTDGRSYRALRADIEDRRIRVKDLRQMAESYRNDAEDLRKKYR